MQSFPRTIVGTISLPRLIIGINWFLGYSHTSHAKDLFIKEYQTRERIGKILAVFLSNDVNAILSSPSPFLEQAIKDAENATGKKMIRLLTPSFSLLPEDKSLSEAEAAFDQCVQLGATFCLPHQCVTDALVDRMYIRIRNIDKYSKMIRERGMIPGLSTHLPETIVIADKTGADIATYIQIYNSAGFLMPVEADWVMHLINKAQKPVLTIKPLASGRILPAVGLSFVWNTIRPMDMVAVGSSSPEEAREIIDISLDILNHHIPDIELQKTRSKNSLQ